ncbi:MAG: bifunctional 4-hydroxy-2-oxoglutarate aldolase/2-dehydro-3-deoxy-phosphogluconate aldolase [Gammaproteobacteria bacterium]|nr:bifunctional 4-hydroxy-2-oxoglutarate aldolase/2-dehydro-3-deoxy-phosphogluconate aldolase [Gammaproteobacteria bacterium]
MHEELLKIQKLKIVPVLALPDARDADDLAGALVEGGLPCAEITFRTEAAADSIRAMARRGDIQVGAGTVLTTAQVDAAVDAGATFIVSPGTNPKVIEYCIKKGVPITPGVATPSDIERALELGIEVLKFFPAETLGGLNALKSISAPYGKCSFIPTGGISAKNVADYLSFPKVIACGGTWIAKKELIQEKQFDQIVSICKEAVAAAAKAR